MSEIKLRVAGRSYGGWTSIEVQQSMDQIAGTFGFASSDKFPDKLSMPGGYRRTVGIDSALWKSEEWDIHPGNPCKVVVEIAGKREQIMADGYIDDMPIMYDSEKHSIQITGRDAAGDLVDSSFVHSDNINEWRGQTIRKLIESMCSPFNIEVYVDSTAEYDPNSEFGVNDIVPKFVANAGDSVFNLISRLCKRKAILPLSYGDGRLILTRAAARKAYDTLELGVNVKSGHLTQSNKDRFSRYIVMGTGNEDFTKKLEDITQPYGEAIDEGVDRFRPLVLVADGAVNRADCLDMAEFEFRNRAAYSRGVDYMVQGWTQSNGVVWPLNAEVRVKDRLFNIDDTRLISRLHFFIDDTEGEVVTVTVVDKKAYELRMETE